jgi:very-short-patch-repair endonuclease
MIPVGTVPDFCIISKGRILRVELDGRQFHENKTGQISIDRSVDMQFQKAGMSTIRFDSHKVHNQIDVVIRDILECVANLP